LEVNSSLATSRCVGASAYHEGATKEIDHKLVSYHLWMEEHFAAPTSSYMFKECVLDKEECEVKFSLEQFIEIF